VFSVVVLGAVLGAGGGGGGGGGFPLVRLRCRVASRRRPRLGAVPLQVSLDTYCLLLIFLEIDK
jgi:hypothetical protein